MYICNYIYTDDIVIFLYNILMIIIRYTDVCRYDIQYRHDVDMVGRLIMHIYMYIYKYIIHILHCDFVNVLMTIFLVSSRVSSWPNVALSFYMGPKIGNQ